MSDVSTSTTPGTTPGTTLRASRRAALLAPAALAAGAVGAAPLLGAAPAAARPRGTAGRGRTALVVPRAEARDWDPVAPEKWSFTGREVVLVERGEAPAGPRRPFEYAVVTRGPELASFHLTAQVRIDEPVSRNDRDVVLLWNVTSPTRFHYVHLSQDNAIYPHNGIFRVDDADRVRIDDQWDGAVGAPPAIDDTDWHRVHLSVDVRSGRIAVGLDGARRPLMTATDRTFTGGRIGFGSFDNHGRVRGLVALGTVAR
ncbi:hypothetical protein RDV89_03170 [Nocardioides zeae]|uniref:LamG domain-containing protein n=1 Tax=Nocardioides imazamoxiresistens TaxID=3231893 RepID=A0ABU3PS85_9ACTN|nr:hypothetical protein [Nocardioides zeae]MDT9592049.1 hypothetical protein [Nocardioides zeae]